MAVAAGTSLLIAAAAGQFSGIVAWAICCTATWLLGRAILSKIPGLTGDTYGALAEGNEVVALFALALVPGGPG